jgi:hypothetical protein
MYAVMDSPTDAEAIAASIATPEAFAVVFDRHHLAVHGHLRRRLGRELADGAPALPCAELAFVPAEHKLLIVRGPRPTVAP